MIRRFVCLMLVPALLASQAAMCCVHTHHGGETEDHSTRSHVHLSGETHASHSDHHHHHGDSDEHDHSGELPVKCSESGLDFDGEMPVDHDSDALYFGEHDNFQITPNRIAFGGVLFATLFFDAEVPRIITSERRTKITRAGPFRSNDCAIFLQTRRLLL